MCFTKKLHLFAIGFFISSYLMAQPEYRVKSIVFDADTSSGFQAGKPITVTYQYENIGNAAGTNIQIFAYLQINELGLRQDVVFDAQSIGNFPPGQIATVSYTFTSNTAAVHQFGGAINTAINVGKISLNIPSKPERNTNNNIRVEPISIFCEGSILNLRDLVITDEQPIVAEEIRITASGIRNGARVTAKADNRIVLSNGFSANEGSRTTLQIGDCNSRSSKLLTTAPTKNVDLPSTILADGVIRMSASKYEGVELLDVSIYPNPSNRFLYMSSSDNTLLVRKLKLYNHLKLVKQMDYDQGAHIGDISISLEGITSGMYILEIELGNGNIITKRVVKK